MFDNFSDGNSSPGFESRANNGDNGYKSDNSYSTNTVSKAPIKDAFGGSNSPPEASDSFSDQGFKDKASENGLHQEKEVLESDDYTPSPTPSPEDSSDEYVEPSARRARQPPTRSRRVIKSESEEEQESQEESDSDDWRPTSSKRKTSRRVKKKVPNQPTRASARSRSNANYDEDKYADQFTESDYEEEVGYVAPQAEEEGDVIESVHDYRISEKEEISILDFPKNIELLIKWKNWSHLHRTWDTFAFLKEFKGIKKVENFIKNVASVDIAIRSDYSISPEELEQRDINIEMERSTLTDYIKVERIVDRREITPNEDCESGTQYLCKWKRLPYSAATWEASELISKDFQEEINSFLTRNQHRYIASRGKSSTQTRPIFKKLNVQPEYLVGGTLRDYQLTGVNWMAYLWTRNENGILADEMGLGKTIQTISFLSYLFHTQQIYGPFLVVVPLSTIGAWQREFARWAPDINSISYIGDGPSRTVIRDHEFYVPKTKKIKFNILLTTFELVLKDRAELGGIKWAFLAVDEAHRLKNSESQLHEALKEFHTANRLLITGTPLQNSIRELSALVHFLMPEKFDISDAYDNIFLEESEGQEAKIRELHESLKPYMLRRLKKDVEKSLPKKTELILRVELSPLQVHYYKNILAKNFSVLNKGATGGSQMSLLNVCAELKKASNHPYLFPNAEQIDSSREGQLQGLIANSGKMILLDKLLTKLKENGSRVLIFSQMVRLLDILADYIAMKGYPYQRLDGSVGSEARKKSIEHFNAPGSPDFVFLLSTRAGGLGINLETADTVIIFDSDWNPQNDLQAMARAHRIGQKKHVNVYRFISKGTMEEDILERAKRKMVLEYCVINQMDTSGQSLLQKGSSSKVNPFSKDEIQAILKFGAARMFSDDEARKKGLDMSLDDILASAEQHETTEGGTAIDGGADFLKQFEVHDYGADDMAWDQIIPENERLKIQDEEDSVLASNLLTSRKRKAVNYQEDGTTRVSTPPVKSNGRARKAPTGPRSRDIRSIYRGILKFGNIPDRYDDIISDGNLSHLDRDLIIEKLDGIVEHCKAFEVSNQPLNPKKAHLVDFEGVDGINVLSVLNRCYDLPLLHKHMRKIEQKTFHLSMDIRPVTNWTVDWSHMDDTKLLLGIYRHGFGNWAKIREDESLNLFDKIFPSDADVPNVPRPTHLNRRGEYLLKTFSKYIETKKAMKSKSKRSRPEEDESFQSIKTHSKPHRSRKSNSPEYISRQHKEESDQQGIDEKTCKRTLRPVKEQLRKLRDESETVNASKKVGLIKECLLGIGSHIEDHLDTIDSRSERKLWKKSLWILVTKFWPKQVQYDQLLKLYEKMKG